MGKVNQSVTKMREPNVWVLIIYPTNVPTILSIFYTLCKFDKQKQIEDVTWNILGILQSVNLEISERHHHQMWHTKFDV